MSDKQFINGLSYKRPHENAPDFVIGALSFNISAFAEWFDAYKAANPDEAWINVDIKESKGGKLYCEVNTYKKSGMTEKPEALRASDDDVASSIPF